MQSDLATASAVAAGGRSKSLLPHFALAPVLQLLAVAHQAAEVCHFRCLVRAHPCLIVTEFWLRVHGSSSHWLAIECRAAWHSGSWLEHSPVCEDVEQGRADCLTISFRFAPFIILFSLLLDCRDRYCK